MLKVVIDNFEFDVFKFECKRLELQNAANPKYLSVFFFENF